MLRSADYDCWHLCFGTDIMLMTLKQKTTCLHLDWEVISRIKREGSQEIATRQSSFKVWTNSKLQIIEYQCISQPIDFLYYTHNLVDEPFMKAIATIIK